ncbi:MAG: hypothetical protein LLF96_09900 [Eubacteriales bacterium]|nr:hypothetical protein [Eubacteriales bacterium]
MQTALIALGILLGLLFLLALGCVLKAASEADEREERELHDSADAGEDIKKG